MPPDVAVYDANVLYPAPLRDLLIRIARDGLVRARWSNRILDECFQNLVLKRPDIRESSLSRTRSLMNAAIRDVLILQTEITPTGVTLPDPDDVHVLDAAVAAGARWIVTFNLRDFPDSALAPLGISAIHPDLYVYRLVEEAPSRVSGVICRQAATLRNPAQSFEELLVTLDRNGLIQTVAGIRSFTGVA